MRREKVDEMLKAYRFEVGRCGHLETQIMQLKREIDLCKKYIPEELASIQPQQLTGMPHGTTVSSPTERSGILLASGWQPEYISAMEAELKSLEEEYSERQFTVLFVSSWLQGLTDRERWIVEHQVIDGEYWKDVAAAYRSVYSDECSKDSLKRLKQRAMDKIYCMAE